MVCKMKPTTTKKKNLYFTIRVLYFKCSLEEHFAKAWVNCKKKKELLYLDLGKKRQSNITLKKRDMFTFNFGYQEFSFL